MALTYNCPTCGPSPVEEVTTGMLLVKVFREFPEPPENGDIEDAEIADEDSSYFVDDDDSELIGYFCGNCKQEILTDVGVTCLSYFELLEVLRRQPHNTETIIHKVVST